MKILVLSGGSVKGAYQAGALKYLLQMGFAPDAILGISVGALNGAFIVNAAQQLKNPPTAAEWENIGNSIEEFWKTNIDKPDKIIVRSLWLTIKRIVSIGFGGKFYGMYSTRPLDNLVDKILEKESMMYKFIEFKCGAVNFIDGKIKYFSNKNETFETLVNGIKASKAIPFILEATEFNNGYWVDGGVIDVAPLGEAFKLIKSNPDKKTEKHEIVIVSVHPENLSPMQKPNDKPTHFPTYASRLMDMVANETIKNDIKSAEAINTILKMSKSSSVSIATTKYATKIDADITHIYPNKQLIIDLKDFNSEHINNLLEQGYKDAKRMYP